VRLLGVWITLSVIALLIILIIFTRVRLVIVSKDTFVVKLRISLFTFVIYDDRKKERPKKRRRPQNALTKQMQKMVSMLSQGHTQSKEPKEESSFTRDAGRSLSLVSNILERIIFPVVKKARVKFRYFKITVASKDPADTAIIYGILCQGVSYLLSVISQNAAISDRQLRKIKLECDFLAEKTVLELHTVISFNIWQLISLIVRGSSELFEKSSAYDSESSQNTNELYVTNK